VNAGLGSHAQSTLCLPGDNIILGGSLCCPSADFLVHKQQSGRPVPADLSDSDTNTDELCRPRNIVPVSKWYDETSRQLRQFDVVAIRRAFLARK